MNPAALASWMWRRQGAHKRRRRAVLALSAVIALASHAVFVRLLPVPWQPNRSSDYRTYYEPVAQQLADGRGFHLPSGKPAIKYPPVIPMVYGATFWLADRAGLSHETGIVALQASLTVLTGVLVTALALQCYGAQIALLACVLWSTYPFHLWLTKERSGETLVCVLLLCTVLVFLKWSARGRAALLWGCACGAVLGFSAMTKPFTIALPAVFLVLAWTCKVPCTRSQRVLFSLSVVLAFALSLSPWEIWVWRESGQCVPLCTNGPASVADGLTFSVLRKGVHPRPQLPRNVTALTNDLATHHEALKSTGGIARLLLDKTKEEPITVARLFLIKAVQSWYSNDSHKHEKWTALIQLFYLPLFVLGAGLARRRNRLERNFFLIAAGVTLYFWAMTTFAAPAIMRYMVPATGILMVLAADAADAFVSVVVGLWARRGSRYQLSIPPSFLNL